MLGLGLPEQAIGWLTLPLRFEIDINIQNFHDKLTFISYGISFHLTGDDSIVMKPNLGYHVVNQRLIEESIHYYVNDEVGPRRRPADSTNEYHYALM